MSKKHLAAIVCGIILALLGGLWFLQGSDLVHIQPIACVADCQPITGVSLQWQISGAVVFVVGAVLIYIGAKRRT